MPAGGREVPQNAPAFAGAPSYSFWEEVDGGGAEERVMHASLARIALDGGVRFLEPIDGGADWSFQLFHPGALEAGETFVLEGDAGGVVRVSPTAPLPKHAGTLAFGQPRHDPGYCAFQYEHRVGRDIFITLSDEAEPWRAVSRVTLLNPSSRLGPGVGGFTRHLFGLPDDETPGVGIRIGSISVNCEEKPARHEVGVAAQFEVAGASVQPSVISATVVLDCADLPPRGCSSAPGGTALALLLLFAQKLVRRRPTPS